ncbi:hypothetical protein NEUTE2DRAFT_123186 [Neurospora tetrasperma FGSC 2509]|nr:hypothetical protein NEUTE2DRAFT_123186 [Neurospora tetrasperma FGSC 2509]
MSVPFITQLQRITDRPSLPLRYPGREDFKRHWIIVTVENGDLDRGHEVYETHPVDTSLLYEVRWNKG